MKFEQVDVAESQLGDKVKFSFYTTGMKFSSKFSDKFLPNWEIP